MEPRRHPETTSHAETTVIVYLPGTMRSIYDQSVDLLADRLAQAFGMVTGRRHIADRNAQSLVLEPGTELRLRTIRPADGAGRTLVLVEADYGPKLTAAFEDSGIVVQFVKLLALVCRMCPTVVRLLVKRVPAPHSRLSRGQKLLVAGAYVVGVAVLVSLGVAAFEVAAALTAALGENLDDSGGLVDALKAWLKEARGILGGYPWVAGVTPVLADLAVVCSIGAAVLAVLWSLMPSSVPGSIVAIGKEYSGLARYILYGDQRPEIDAYLSAVRGCVVERHPDADVHLVCFSFGCVVGFNHLFPRPEWRQQAPGAFRTVTFMGFPYIVIEAAFPGYLGGRTVAMPAGAPWKNVFLANDVLGSRLQAHLGQIFPTPPPPALHDVKVEPQKSERLNFVADHMAYWDPDDPACSEAFFEVARSIAAG
jgi:hypothetical protein